VTSTRAATLRERPAPVGLLFSCMSYRIGSRRAKEGNPQTLVGVACAAPVFWRAILVRLSVFTSKIFVTNMLRMMRRQQRAR
jgi:hypothetical protein